MFTPNKIIIHHSASDDGPGNNTAAIRDWHVNHNGWLAIGYHALVEKLDDSYEAIIGRSWNVTGAHTIGQNDKALGLCLVGNFNIAFPSAEQLKVAARLTAMWCRMFSISENEIYRHSFFQNTDCPGYWFDLEQFKAMVLDE